MIETLEHRGPVRVAFDHDTAADRFERRTRQRFVGHELVEELDRDIELAHGPERRRQSPNLATRLAAFRALDARGQHRHRFPQAPRCDPCLVHTVGVAVNRMREMAFERRSAAREQAARDRGDSAVHGRMTAQIWEKTANKSAKLGPVPPVYNGHVTEQAPSVTSA